MQGWNVPYGYRLTEKGLEPDPYQSKVVKLAYELVEAGVTPEEADYLIISKFKVPKLKETRPIDFEELKQEMLRYIQAARKEEGMQPLEIKL
jgi:hypothetical protein